MPYTVMLITLVAMPMLIMTSEIVRMMFVDVHLQAAVDAACAAASQAVDVPLFILTGELKIDPIRAAASAQIEFDSTVGNSDINQYSPTLSSISISGGTIVYCQAGAVMTWMLPGISSVNLTANSVAGARASR